MVLQSLIVDGASLFNIPFELHSLFEVHKDRRTAPISEVIEGSTNALVVARRCSEMRPTSSSQYVSGTNQVLVLGLVLVFKFHVGRQRNAISSRQARDSSSCDTIGRCSK